MKKKQFFGCCCELETGTKIISIVGIILFITDICLLIAGKLDLGTFFFNSIVTTSIFMIIAVIGLCACVSLLYGTITKRKPFINVWIIVNIISFIVDGLLLLAFFVWVIIVSAQSAYIIFSFMAIYFGIYYHIIYSVNYFYKTIDNENVQQKLYTIHV